MYSVHQWNKNLLVSNGIQHVATQGRSLMVIGGISLADPLPQEISLYLILLATGSF